MMDVTLVEKYLNGNATPEEAECVIAWLQTEEGQHYIDHRFQLDIEQLDEISTEFERPENAYRTLAGIEEKMQWRRRAARINRFYRTSSIVAVAACIAFLVAFVALMGEQLGLTPLESEEPVSIVIHATGYGEQKIIQMSDGSSIRLNENSRLEMPEQFRGEERSVRLQGQAYFEIAHDEQVPFEVHMGDALVRVLGTAFDVNEATRLGQVQVAVTEGRVALSSSSDEQGREVVLEANTIGLLNITSREVISESADVSNYLSWVSGRVVYDRTPFGEVIRQLERIYELSSIVRDEELLELRLTADFSERSMMNVLEVIAHSLEIDFEMRGDVVEWKKVMRQPSE